MKWHSHLYAKHYIQITAVRRFINNYFSLLIFQKQKNNRKKCISQNMPKLFTSVILAERQVLLYSVYHEHARFPCQVSTDINRKPTMCLLGKVCVWYFGSILKKKIKLFWWNMTSYSLKMKKKLPIKDIAINAIKMGLFVHLIFHYI